MPENIVRKRENAGNQRFLPYPQGFQSFPKEIIFWVTFQWVCPILL